MSRTKHVTVGNTARRNGETRTHGPLVPNQVRYLLRHIPLGGCCSDDKNNIVPTLSSLWCYHGRNPRYGNQRIRAANAAGNYGLIIQHCLVAWWSPW